MELFLYLFIKPYVLIFEASFTVLGRILGFGSNLMITFLVGLLLYMPFYLEAKSFQKGQLAKVTDKNGKKHLKDIILIAVAHILPILSQILLACSANVFVREIYAMAGEKYLFITDLSKPDGLIAHAVNLLPILYFVINSATLFINKKPLYLRVVSLAEYLILTVIIYSMPSGALLLWMLFSVIMAITEILKLIYITLREKDLIKEFKKKENKSANQTPDYLLYFSGLCYLILLAGFYIPTNIIKISTQEFVDVTDMHNPLYFILYSMALSVGMFAFHGIGYYMLGTKEIKLILERIVWVLAGISSVDYVLSGAYQGEISPSLAYFDPREFEPKRIILSVVLGLAISVVFLIVIEKKKNFMKLIALAQFGVLLVSIVMNTVKITSEYHHMNYIKRQETEASITLGKNGKNVVVLIMDRALGPVVPFLFEEKPELKEEFDGFIWYPNTVSFGAYTNTGIPSVYGGYEYTPEEMNKRSDESLADKHNESLKVLPVLFAENGYDATVIDPAYAGYNWIPDLSIYDDIEGVKAFRLEGTYENQYPDDYIPEKESLKRNFFFHAIVKMSPLNWQDMLYDSGYYCDLNSNQCIRTSKYTQNGYFTNFLKNYYVLKNLPELTVFDEGEGNYFVSLYNGTPHMECLLKEPEYVPAKHVDNRSLHPDDENYLYAGDRVLKIEMPVQVEFYHVDMATFLMLGEWFDYLKQNGCYDNTRIIIVADHGADVEHFDSVLENNMDVEAFMPMLLMKDFDAHGYAESDERMTNADVAYLATRGVIENAKNPFTGNPLDAHEKSEMDEFHIFYSENNTLSTNHGNVYKPDLWFSVKGDPYDLSNWNYLGKY